jgi:hypothetical protein
VYILYGHLEKCVFIDIVIIFSRFGMLYASSGKTFHRTGYGY